MMKHLFDRLPEETQNQVNSIVNGGCACARFQLGATTDFPNCPERWTLAALDMIAREIGEIYKHHVLAIDHSCL